MRKCSDCGQNKPVMVGYDDVLWCRQCWAIAVRPVRKTVERSNKPKERIGSH